MEEFNNIRSKWYEIGLQLGVSVGTLNAIKKDYHSTSDCLRETLTIWLKTSPSPPTWNNIVDVLRRSTVGELRLAADLEKKYCLTPSYYYSPHTSYLFTVPFPLTPPPSGAATAAVHPSYSQLSQVTPTSSRPLLPLLPAQLTIPQFPPTFLHSPSSSFHIDTPQDVSSIPPPSTVTTPPDLPPPVTTRTLGMQVSQLHLP